MTFPHLFYLALAAIGAYAAITAQTFKAAAYPRALGVILCACSLVQFARAFRKTGKSGRKPLTAEQRAVLYTMLATLAYVLLLRPLGFILASVGFMGGLMWLHGYRYPGRIAAVSLPAALGLYLFFTRVVHIGLPRGPLPF